MSIESRLRALLALLDAARDAQCGAQRERAHHERRSLIVQAWRTARRHMRERLEAERQRHAKALEREDAALAIERRLAHQRAVGAALQETWTRMHALLRRRWSEAPSRKTWIEHHLATAARLLGPGPWRIEHGPDWTAADCTHARAWRAQHAAGETEFVLDPAIAAGLRVRRGHNVFDASLDGLLGDRSLIEGRLLDSIESRPA